MTAPARADNALAPISNGQVWFCRMFSSTSVFRFRGAILKVAFEPYPHLHVLVPEVIEKRNIRRTPRCPGRAAGGSGVDVRKRLAHWAAGQFFQ